MNSNMFIILHLNSQNMQKLYYKKKREGRRYWLILGLIPDSGAIVVTSSGKDDDGANDGGCFSSLLVVSLDLRVFLISFILPLFVFFSSSFSFPPLFSCLNKFSLSRLKLIYSLFSFFLILGSLFFLFSFSFESSLLTPLGSNSIFILYISTLSLSNMAPIVSFAPLFIGNYETTRTFLGEIIMVISSLELVSTIHHDFTLWPSMLMLAFLYQFCRCFKGSD